MLFILACLIRMFNTELLLVIAACFEDWFQSSCFRQQPACAIADKESGDASDCGVPGKGYAGEDPDVNVEDESNQHANHCAGLACAFCEDAEQEYAEQATISYGCDGEAHFQHLAAAAREDCQAE